VSWFRLKASWISCTVASLSDESMALDGLGPGR
jgi:hypothetical protein